MKDSFYVSEKNVFKKDHYFFCFSKSCLHGLSDAFYVLAIKVVLYQGRQNGFSSGGHGTLKSIAGHHS